MSLFTTPITPTSRRTNTSLPTRISSVRLLVRRLAPLVVRTPALDRLRDDLVVLAEHDVQRVLALAALVRVDGDVFAEAEMDVGVGAHSSHASGGVGRHDDGFGFFLTTTTLRVGRLFTIYLIGSC